MNSVLNSHPLSAPHLLQDPRLSPSRTGMPTLPDDGGLGEDTNMDCYTDSYSPSMSGRKRKASEEPLDGDRMSTSPAPSPSAFNRTLPPPSSSTQRSIKRTRTHTSVGRPLPLPRLLQTLDADDMRQLLQNICDQNPHLKHEVVTKAPRPSVDSTLSVLAKYNADFRKAFPLGNRPTSDYAYNRVKQHLEALLEALRDYTPYYLPPQETQTSISLAYLDSVTNMIHNLPDWDSYQHNRYKHEAYDDISRAWGLVIREAAKRAGGFHLQFGGWDSKLVDHNAKSGGRMEEAVNELKGALGFMQAAPASSAESGNAMDERAAVRQALFAGTYGQDLGVGSGRW